MSNVNPKHLLPDICRNVLEDLELRLPSLVAQEEGWKANYAEFRKKEIPLEIVRRARHKSSTFLSVRAEIVEVLTSQKRFHSFAEKHALVYILGHREGVLDARGARIYKSVPFGKTDWESISSGLTIEFPPGTVYGFSRDEDGTLYYLSVEAT